MVQKKRKTRQIRKPANSKSIFEKEIKTIEKEVKKDILEIEGWVKERRKFLIKLGIVGGLIVILLIISHIYLRVSGFG